MTSAEFTTGYGEKSSSRVLRPPGGGSSNIFGTAEPEPVKVADQKSDTKENIYGSGDVNTAEQQVTSEQKQNNTEAEENSQNKKSEEEEENEGESKEAINMNENKDQKKEQQTSSAKPRAGNPITGENMPPPVMHTKQNQAGFNPITGEAYGEAQKKLHTTTKVRQPPGGASSGLW